jgi:hypothetical protein
VEKLGPMVVIQAGAFPLEGLALLERADRVERMIVISHGRPVERLGPSMRVAAEPVPVLPVGEPSLCDLMLAGRKYPSLSINFLNLIKILLLNH